MLDRELVELLACPVCKTPLSYNTQRETLHCASCRRVYPIRNGIPILLRDEAVIEE